ncbi:MAG: acyl carrier protein [Bacteroidetes bacterium]|nr:acyl carrier protein [Bacteroidota bacterium]
MDGIDTFIEKIEAEFDDVKKGTLVPATSYKDIEGWSSMQALILIAFIDSEYDVMLSGEDLNNTLTIQDIYNIVKSKKG